jgi:DNA-binding transcriptional ArsR family regulator
MPEAEPQAPFAYNGLERVFHEKARLGVVCSLAAHAEGLTFSELKSLCGLTDGNLSRHLQVLEEAGYVVIEKGYEGKRPQTRCRLSDDGRTRFSEYLVVLEQVLRRATQATARVGGLAQGFTLQAS